MSCCWEIWRCEGKGAGAYAPLMPPAGQHLFWGRSEAAPALPSPGIGLTANPDFCALCALGDIEQVGMVETVRIAPFAGIGLVGAGHIDGIEAVIVPDGCCDQADLEFLCRLVCHGSVSFY